MIDTIRQFQIVSPVSTFVAILRCMCRFDSHKLPASFFRFTVNERKEESPSYISDTFRQFMIFHHIENLKILNANYAKFINYFTAFLMSKILTLESYALMHTRNYVASVLALFTAFLGSGKLALNLSKFFLFLPKELWIFYLAI